MAERKMDAVLRHVDKMPPLPTTALKVVEIANDPRSSITDMDKVIAMDTVLSAKLLKMVNSSYFGLRDKITTTGRAIAHLGMNTVKNLVLCSCVIKNLSEGSRFANFDMETFWKHSMGCSVAAKLIAKRLGLNNHEIEDISLAALLHDIGKLALIQYSPEEYLKVVAFVREKKVSYFAAERSILAADTVMRVKEGSTESGNPELEAEERRIDHCYIGYHLAKKWSLPEIMTDVFSNHHMPWDNTNPETGNAVHIVCLANAFCKMNELGFGGDVFVPVIKDETWRVCGINATDLMKYREKWEKEVSNAQEFLA